MCLKFVQIIKRNLPVWRRKSTKTSWNMLKPKWTQPPHLQVWSRCPFAEPLWMTKPHTAMQKSDKRHKVNSSDSYKRRRTQTKCRHNNKSCDYADYEVAWTAFYAVKCDRRTEYNQRERSCNRRNIRNRFVNCFRKAYIERNRQKSECRADNQRIFGNAF